MFVKGDVLRHVALFCSLRMNDVDIYNLPFLWQRAAASHKGHYGHALLVAGSYGKMGAAVLAARAALRAGVGLLTVHVPRCGVDIMQTAVPEAMLSIDDGSHCFSTLPAQLERYDAVAAGPGLGTDEATQKALLALLQALDPRTPRLLDADALNILARHPEALSMPAAAAASTVLTPHAAEYERLFADAEPQAMANLHGLTIVAKGHHTAVCAPKRVPLINADAGNAGMATAGSGDVLTGITLGLMAQNVCYPPRHGLAVLPLQTVAFAAVRLHALAGDRAALRRSQPALIASDLIDNLLCSTPPEGAV